MLYFIDLDGTLIDNRKRLHRLFCDLSGADYSFEEYWRRKAEGKLQGEMLGDLGFSPEEKDNFKKLWLEKIETPEYLALDEKMPGADAFLQANAEDRLYLWTNRQSRASAELQVKKFGWEDCFADLLVTEQKKTKEELLKEFLAERAGLQKDCIAIGDTSEDCKAAEAAGIRFVDAREAII